FVEYAIRMIIPTLFSLVATITVLLIYFRKSIPRKYDISNLKKPEEAINDIKMFRISWYVLGLLVIGYFVSEFINLLVSIVAGIIAILFIIMDRLSEGVDTKYDIIFDKG